MASVTIFGNGNMGSAIDKVLTAGGATVDHITTESAGATVTGDTVVLAVPHPAVAAVLDAYGYQLAGKVVVDITNPLDFATFDGLVVPADSSKAAEIAAALPDSTVLKAFNTTFAAALASGTVGQNNATTVLIAGDDADAKADLAAVITAGGLEAVDAGSLKRARELEAIGFLQITLAAGEKIGWTGGLAVVQ